ncbi:glycoside hydrolase family 26 protein [Arcticibacter tournemirensis]|uniref:GH26 domain-containing protein n=1 Tax=Arcticibacter tournemirensis TaxID=699437 RepID=A0A4V1KHR9_9SPHI|nr:hypothetical protein [Arcticibacter tournemirensis]RXF68152.1 hypothetical protein EKH83_16585 [Arcticibacter tournemirensis]
MGKRYTFYLSLFFLMGVVLYSKRHVFIKNRTESKDIIIKDSKQQALGIFYHGSDSSYVTMPAIAHYSLQWMNTDQDTVENSRLIDSLSHHETAFLSIETWAGYNERNQQVNVLEDVINGAYDDKIRKLCDGLSGLQDKVLLSFNPDMEVPVKKYPWQYQSPVEYIKAFRHFSGLVKKLLPRIKIVWSPAGYPGADEYWPGDTFADLISVSLLGESERACNNYPLANNTTTLIRRKIHRMRMIYKPIIVLGSEKIPSNFKNRAFFEIAAKTIGDDWHSIQPLKKEAAPQVSGLKNTDRGMLIGVYDPRKLLINEKAVSVEHLFADWGAIEDGTLERQIDSINSRGRSMIITVEPWRGKRWPTSRDVLKDMINGMYDPIIETTYRIISRAKHPVFLRFAHEMEIPTMRYPWQSQDPVTYIKAYRYFMQFGAHLKNIRRVWGPAGDRGSLEWWPGDDVVDYTSIAIYGLPDKNITDPRLQESFSTIFKRKSYRMRLVNKPLFITEFGVKGSESFQNNWLKDAAFTIRKSNIIAGVCYFNQADNPEVWGKIPAPDWGVSETTFENFVETLSN